MSRRRVRGAGDLLAFASRLGREARRRAKGGAGASDLPTRRPCEIGRGPRAAAEVAALRRPARGALVDEVDATAEAGR